MKFIEEIVDYVLDYGSHLSGLDRITVVFPNKRAGLFFRKQLASRIDKPVFSPKVLGMVDFIRSFSSLQVPDRMSLVFELYRQFKTVGNATESFDRFYYWGEVLLRDFDELDRYMVDADVLFTNLAQLKEIESDLSHLTQQQQDLIRSFWDKFGEKMSRHQKQFLSIWQGLYKIYDRYQKALLDKGWAYDGLIYRSVAMQDDLSGMLNETSHVIFAGFNALSLAEERIIQTLLEQKKAWVIWDLDDYYFKDVHQEAGHFTRDLQLSNPVIRETFKKSYGNQIKNCNEKAITVLGVPLNAGQAQASATVLEDLLTGMGPEIIAGETVLVLPAEQLLFPVLHALPQEVDKVNITMGYPIKDSQAFGFIEALIELQLSAGERPGFFYYKPVIALLTHPYLSSLENEQVNASVDRIGKENIIWIAGDDISGAEILLKRIFSRQKDQTEMIDYLQDLLIVFSESSMKSLHAEFLYHFYILLNRLKDFIYQNKVKLDEKSFLMLFRQVAGNYRLPFEGEPLEGLQIMGILETRNLDFENVIVCSMNEDTFPPGRSVNSFIPYNLRKAYGLPTFDHQDALYAYLFYRMIHRAKNIYFIYNTDSGKGQSGEMSRYIQQLQLESGISMTYTMYSPKVYPGTQRDIFIPNDEEAIQRLQRYVVGSDQGSSFLTPSALNTYLDCSLRFYFRYIAGIFEEEQVSEEIDPMVFGQILHNIMEHVYKPFNRNAARLVKAGDIDSIIKHLDKTISTAFSDHFKHGSTTHTFKFTGQNAIAREVIRKMVTKVLHYDKNYAPFEIVGLEAGNKDGYQIELGVKIGNADKLVRIGGFIDRIDLKDEVVRILDYKTGKDNKVFENIPSIFDREDKARNKAALQTFLYGLIYKKRNPDFNGKLQAGLFNIRELFTPGFSFQLQQKTGNSRPVPIDDIGPFLPDFIQHLKILLENIFSGTDGYRQVEEVEKCVYCPYRTICRR